MQNERSTSEHSLHGGRETWRPIESDGEGAEEVIASVIAVPLGYAQGDECRGEVAALVSALTAAGYSIVRTGAETDAENVR